jgi:hypothetical protein
MPLLYMTPDEVQEHPLGMALAAQIASLPSGALDKLLMLASKRCNTYTKRRLQAPQSTTVASPGATAGSTSLPVTSTLGTDNLEEFAVMVGTGGAMETILLQPGGIQVSSYTAPYPGTFTLASPLVNNHEPGDPVVGIYIETRKTGSSSDTDIYEDVVTQQAQIAAVHGGGYDFLNADRTRYHWLDQYPLIGILGMLHAYPYTAEYQAVDVPSLLITPNVSRVKFPVGTFILANGLLKTTYTAGYEIIPDDIQEAVINYLKEDLSNFVNPYGVAQQTQGKRAVVFNRSTGGAGSTAKSLNVQAAEAALEGYKR